MTGYLIVLGLGLAAGIVIGFVLGLESPRRCGDCAASAGSRYMVGYKDGFRAGAENMKNTVEVRGLDAKGVWHISHKELDEALEDVVDTAYV